MTTRSRIVLIGSVSVLVTAFVVLWARSLERSWNEARVMPLLGDDEQYKRVVDETTNALEDVSETWRRVSEPPRVEIQAPAETLPQGASERIEQALKDETTSTNP